MGKFLETKDSGVQGRVIKKCSKNSGKSVQKSSTEHDEHHKLKRKRKLPYPSDQGSPLKKPKPGDNTNEIIWKDAQNENKSQFQDLEIELKRHVPSGKQYLKLLRPDGDLFADDDVKARYDQYTKFNLIFHVFDEIALEGLDGITLEAYWKRLYTSLKFPTCIDNIKECIWHIICSNNKITFFELPEAREDLVILSRDAYINKDKSVYMEVYQTGPDLYKVVFDPRGNEWGSCATLATRVNISEQVRTMTLNEAYSTYKNKLVMVADPQLRINALFDDLTDPNYEYTQTEYCLLERIGRSRELGEITQGPAALSNCFGKDSQSVFHYCNRFSRENLVTKQFFCVRSHSKDQSKVGRLLQLRRFYTKKKSKYMILTESVINYLKKCPGYKAPYSEIKSLFVGPINAKFFKNQEFLKFVNTQVFVPYTELYPEATYKEYMTKSKSKERVLQMVQLKDPFINIVASWSDSPQLDSDDEDGSESDDDTKIGGGRILNMEFIREVYLVIHSTGNTGSTTIQLNNKFNVDFSTVRSTLRKLLARNLIQCNKKDMGRQKTNEYVATCFVENPSLKISKPLPKKTESSSAIGRLKQRQQQKIDSLDKDRVYTRERFEADQLDVLGLEKPALLSITFAVPQILCEYLIAKLTQCNVDAPEILAELTDLFRPFLISLTYPKLADSTEITLGHTPPTSEVNKPQIPINFSNVRSSVFKSDYITKACLLQAHFCDKIINDREIIEWLDPNFKKSQEAVKRISAADDQSSATPGESIKSLNLTRMDLANYMGPNPVLILREEDDAGEAVSDLYLATPPDVYRTGDITDYVCPPNNPTTERVLSRIKLILETVQAIKVFEEVHKLLRIILDKESKEGYDKKMDRKSLHRIVNRLASEGYIKLYYCIVSNKRVKKCQTFICHPDINHRHKVIRNGMNQLKFRFFCVRKDNDVVEVVEPVEKKPKPVKTSPFGEYDVLQSIQEINELHVPKHVKLKAFWNRRAGKLYGFRPKFARMSLLHEILFYLIYVQDQETQALPKEEVVELFRTYKIKLTDEDLQRLPPVYYKEISWRMFIPPLPHHEGWEDGWALLCDVILRIPLTLIVRLYCINFLSTELQEILQHPIKRFYLLSNLPSQIQYLVMHKRKCIHDIHLIMVRLAYCGLLQFGPSRFKEKDQGFVYLNRNASLLETMTSELGYNKITNKHYDKVSFYLDSLESVSKYWFTMHNICMNTLLNARLVMEGKTVTFIDVTAKPSLNKAVMVKTQEEVKKYDTGEIPGDNRGAAGLDSAMWSHIQRNWAHFATKSAPSFKDELALLRLDQVMPEHTSFEHLKLPPVHSKFYLGKAHEIRPVSTRKIKPKKTSKRLPVIRKVIKAIQFKKKKKEKDYYDAVDKAILRRYSGVRFRPHWSEEEDKVLMLLKVASVFVTPGTSKQLINYTVIRDVLHRAVPESGNKTSRSIPRRYKILNRDVSLMSVIDNLVLHMYKLIPVIKYFVPLRSYIINGRDASGRRFKLSDSEVQNAFIFMAYYMLNHRREVETALHGNLTSVDYLKKENLEYTMTRLVPIEQETIRYRDPGDVEEIRKYVLKNVFHSTLGHKDDHPAWSYQMYKICQKFNQNTLISAIDNLRELHMITSQKEPLKKFYTSYKLSLTYVFSQTTTFTYQTMEEAYAAFLELKKEKVHVKLDSIEDTKYGQLFAFNEVITLMMSDVNLKFWFPEHHFILNPAIEDHGPVIEELAKRYLAKIKGGEKTTELQDSTQITEPEPEPEASSSTAAEDIETLQFDEDEPLDLTITATNSATITNLKHWISDCIDAERVRSPSPELLNLDASHELEEETREEEPKADVVGESKEKDEGLLSLQEIKEEILKVTLPNEKRKVPYITDLAKLLSENFDDIDTDEQTINEMKMHFIQQYPRLEELHVEGFNSHYLVQNLEKRQSIEETWRKVEREAYVVEPNSNSEAFDEILETGGTVEDVDLASELITFICGKGVVGATGPELKADFHDVGGNCTLEYILKVLCKHNILLRTGVCSVTFIHHSHQAPWLADTFVLTSEHINVFKKKNPKDQLVKLEEDIDECLRTTQWIKVKTVPWIKMDGALDRDLLKVWLSSIFSYCIENPKTLLKPLFDRFCFLKPVDLFYLLEILQDLGCVEMRRMQRQFDLFSEYKWSPDCRATILDKFEEIYVEPNQISFCALGSFFHNTLKAGE